MSDLCGLGLDLQIESLEKVLISFCSSKNRTKSAHVSFRGLLQFTHVENERRIPSGAPLKSN